LITDTVKYRNIKQA